MSSEEQSEDRQELPSVERECADYVRNQSEERQFEFEMDGTSVGAEDKDKMQCLQVNPGQPKGQGCDA